MKHRAQLGFLVLMGVFACSAPCVAHAQLDATASVGVSDRLRLDCGRVCDRPLILPLSELTGVERQVRHDPSLARILATAGAALAAGYVTNLLLRDVTAVNCADAPCERNSGWGRVVLGTATVAAGVGTGVLVWRFRRHAW